MSLKKSLHDRIRLYEGKLYPYDEVERICRVLGYKISNAERRLRPSESPDIQTVYSEKGFIIGYKYQPELVIKNEGGQLSF